jgi:hypothetical protein
MSDLSSEDQDLINRIKQKIASGAIMDMMESGYKPVLYPPASSKLITATEKKLGFKLPALIRELYLQVGNGGFGPAYGIAGLKGGTLMYDEWTMPELSVLMRDGDGDPAYARWRDSLIVYCEWGCNVNTVVDCSSPKLKVYVWENPPGLQKHSSRTLRQWWENWLDNTIQQY